MALPMPEDYSAELVNMDETVAQITANLSIQTEPLMSKLY